jgi:hypothetical protein
MLTIETNRMQLLLFGMQNKTCGSYLAATRRNFVSVMILTELMRQHREHLVIRAVLHERIIQNQPLALPETIEEGVRMRTAFRSVHDVQFLCSTRHTRSCFAAIAARMLPVVKQSSADHTAITIVKQADLGVNPRALSGKFRLEAISSIFSLQETRGRGDYVHMTSNSWK